MHAQCLRLVSAPALAYLFLTGGVATGTASAAPPPSPAAFVPDGEPPIAATGAEGDYLRAMHTAIHFKWATKFVQATARSLPATDPVNAPNLEAEVLFVVRWDGSPAQVTLGDSSGVPEFDAAAMAAVSGDRPYPVPPIDLYGDDGVVHVRWLFRRDQHLCSLAEIRRMEAPLAEALPRLFVQGRVKEAMLRVVRESRAGHADAVSAFARAYLSRRFSDPILDAHAAAALATTGDPRVTARLQSALARPDTMPIAAPAAAAAKMDLCAAVRPALEGSTPEATLFASRTLRTAGAELPSDSPCLGILTATVKAGLAPAAVRADMLETLATVSPGGVRRFAVEAIGDQDPKLRAAGTRALARPGGGRPVLYRLQPLIVDPSSEVRAAVAAGLVRACGDLANDFLTPILKGKDVRPLVALAEALGQASSPASAELLGKLQKRPEPELRLPVLAALARRPDAPARALYRPLAEKVKADPYAAPEARRIVFSNADPDELARVAKDPVLGIYAFRALLRAGRRDEALDWIVASYDWLPPETLVDVFGAWLTNPPGKLSAN